MLKILALMAAVALVASPALAEEGCPSGLLKSDLQNRCIKPSEWTTLPLDDDQPMRFEALQVSMALIYIQAIGQITHDTPAEFERFLATRDAKMSRNLYLHSRGGNLMAGLKLGEKIREAGYNTGIGRSIPLDGAMDNFDYPRAMCASACAYAFLGGKTRSYDAKAVYGLHRFGLRGQTISGDDAQVIGGLLASYVQRMGVDQAVLEAAATASFKDDLFEVPVDLAEKMKVIFDASGRTSFSVELHDDKPLAKFRIVKRDREWPAIISCNGPQRLLTVVDPEGTIPEVFRAAQAFPAAFKDGAGKTLRAKATYLHVSDRRGMLTFDIPGLTATSFEGAGLVLDNIWHPEIERHYNLKPRPADAFAQKALWIDQVVAFEFTIVADNGRKTLPLVLNQCTPKRK